jgi:hypothetical protein
MYWLNYERIVARDLEIEWVSFHAIILAILPEFPNYISRFSSREDLFHVGCTWMDQVSFICLEIFMLSDNDNCEEKWSEAKIRTFRQ